MSDELTRSIEKDVLALFTNWLQGDSVTLERCQHIQQWHHHEDLLVFTLQQLFELFNDRYPSLEYIQFRSCLYQSRINERLADMGYAIKIQVSTHKIDTNSYALVKL